ncbi:hypothetical protein MRX96_004296 [Rhipicephalus microplus]
MFQDLMAKKLATWDRMMGSSKDEERAQGLDMFRKLSDEEVDLANRTVSKNRLKEFIDLKIQYFDQLAGENNAKVRSEGLKKFQQVCENELALAKSVVPKDVLLEESDSAKKQKEEEKKEEEKKEARKPTDAVHGTHPMAGMMYGMPLSITPEQMRAMMMANSQAASTSRMLAMQTGMQDVPVAESSQMGSEHRFLTQEQFTALCNADGTLEFNRKPRRFPSWLPSRPLSKSSMADVRVRREEIDDTKPPVSDVEKTPVSDIDKKLKLLNQLESARGVLQNHYPPDSSTSMAEEVRNRLRKINRMQMKVIDEIIGSKADLTSEIVSDLRPEKYEREGFDDAVDAKEKKGKKGKRSKEPKKIIVELPEYSEPNTHVVAASISRFDARGLCTGTTDLCPGPQESRPEVLWERPRSETRAPDRTTIIVNRPEQGVQTETAQPPPAEPSQPQAALPVPPQPVQKAPEPSPSPQIHVQTVDVKESSSSDKRFAKSCEESLQRIADSVDDILSSLGSLSSDYAQGSDDPPPRRQRQRSRGRRRTSGGDDGPSLWGWLCRSVRSVRDGSPSDANQNDSHTMQVANRIRELVQKVIRASNEVIMARKAIQRGGLQGEIAKQNVLETEDKLWQLINLESQLANELAQYRTLDTTADPAYFDSLARAEDKIRRLIQVETQLANEIGAWRQLSSQMPQSTSYTRTTMYRVPGYSTSTSATGLLSPSTSSTGYTS